ncbi:MAG: hypothetical protein ABJD05_10495, partial [Roseibium sp.]|uniref:hypothetical protein n=1 Tax=Roseibium sp. TaxID=1936156 RepID=UPI003267A787
MLVPVVNKAVFYRAVSNLLKQFDAAGLRVRRGEKFEELEALVERDGLKHQLTEHFKTALNTFTPATAFWLALENDHGCLVAIIAARLDDLGHMSLRGWWEKYWRRCYPGLNDELLVMAADQPTFAECISGRIVYLGELIVAEPLQSGGIGGALTQLAQLDALQEWRPDYIYGWVRPAAGAERGRRAWGFRG